MEIKACCFQLHDAVFKSQEDFIMRCEESYLISEMNEIDSTVECWMVLRWIFGPKRDEATGEWRRLHNEELNELYSSANIIRVIKSRRMRWAGHVARMGEKRGADRVLVGRREGRRSLGRPRRRWEDNIKMDLQEVGWGMEWFQLTQDRDRWRDLVNAVMNLRVP
jgi:hypothetical protein